MGDTNIVNVIEQGDLQGMKDLLAGGLDIQGRFPEQRSVPDLGNTLNGRSAPDALRNDHKPNPLEFAVSKGKIEIVELLIKHGADVNAQGGYYTALQHAVLKGHLAIAKFLIETGADVNKERCPTMYDHFAFVDTWGYAPWVEDPASMEAYQDAERDLGILRARNQTAFSVAIEYGRVEMIQLLLDKGLHSCSDESSAIITSVAYGRAEILSILLQHFQISENNASKAVAPLPTKHSPLHIAAYYGKADVLEILLEKTGKALVNSQDAEGLTPLHYAARKGFDHIAQALIEYGARGDIPDFSNNTTAFEISLSKYMHRPESALLFYPASRGLHLPATQWRKLMQVDSTAAVKLTESHFELLDNSDSENRWSYPVPTSREGIHTVFIQLAEMRTKRIFIVGESDFLSKALSGLHCHWRVRSQDADYWEVQVAAMPSRQQLAQSAPGRGLLECYFTVRCLALPLAEDEWPSSLENSLPSDRIDKLWKTHGIGWVMLKSERTETEGEHSPVHHLTSAMFFSTSEYAQVPQFPSSLFIPLMDALKEGWELNFQAANNRLSLMRTKLLLASGDNPRLIKDLLIDALLWDILRKSADSQVSELSSLRRTYTGQEMQIVREEDKKTTEDIDVAFQNSLHSLSQLLTTRLANLKETSSELIQLEFNLSSINEAQKSRSTNLSMKRLSWITFIFLPLTFISSLFGMNIDILATNVAWWTYIPFAFVTLGLTMFIWLIFKYNQNLEVYIEDQFKRLLHFLSRKRTNVEIA